jgi:type II secretory pathway pseudopilin PulG
MSTSHAQPPRRGFTLVDTMLGLALVAGMLVLLAVDLEQHRRTTGRLAQRRAALNLAEQVLTDLQAGRPAPSQDGGLAVRVAEVPSPAAAPKGGRWVEVRVTGPAGAQSLIGLVGASRAEGRP